MTEPRCIIDTNSEENIFNYEDNIIDALDAGVSVLPKVLEKSTDTFNKGQRVVIDVPTHRFFLRPAIVIGFEHGRYLLQIERTSLTMWAYADDLISYEAAKKNPRRPVKG